MITRKEIANALYEFDASFYEITYDMMGYETKEEAIASIFYDMYENFIINKDKNILVRGTPAAPGVMKTVTYQIDLQTKKIVNEMKFEEENIMREKEIQC